MDKVFSNILSLPIVSSLIPKILVLNKKCHTNSNAPMIGTAFPTMYSIYKLYQY